MALFRPPLLLKGSPMRDGLARLLDWRGTMNLVYEPPQRRRTPAESLGADWRAIDGYFRAVLAPPPEPPPAQDG